MGEATKEKALEKLTAFLPNIGYPNEWRDFSSVEIDRQDLMGNVRRLREYFEADAIRRLSEPTDRHEWFSPAHTVNAFYNPQFNAITFPAGILEPPFFNPAADPAVNYGAIGAVIGHEMGHGFDDQGSKSDARGVQQNWWTDEDRQRFEEKAARLAAQYSAYEAVPGTYIDGRFTLGENIGDLGGVDIAYHAYRASLGDEEAPVLDGLTGDQRFFLAYAQLWRAIYREEAVVARLKADPHAPPAYRANGVVRNVDAWYQAFDVGEDSDLYLPPEERVSIW
jgi:predicted metalloendopeptidase